MRGREPLRLSSGFPALLVLVFSSIALVQHGAADQPRDAEFERAHGELLEERDLQFDRPEAPPEEKDDPLGPEGDGYISPFGGSLNALGPLAKVVFWGIIAVLVVGLIGFMLQRIGRAGAGDTVETGPGAMDDRLGRDRPEAAIAEARLAEADRLAAEGRYAEAVHVLLFRSIEDVEAERKAGLARSLTAREITALEGLPTRARDALKPITSLVERGIFGAKLVDAEDYAAARAAYSDFAFGAAG